MAYLYVLVVVIALAVLPSSGVGDDRMELPIAANAASSDLDREWRFRAMLDDKEIGYHRFRLYREGSDRVRLESQAEFKVKFLFIKLYGYEHSAVEQWSDGCLTQFSSLTNDNGTTHRVRAHRSDGVMTVMTQDATNRMDDCVMTFAYWNPDILQRNRLLNPQTGAYLQTRVRHVGRDVLQLGAQSIPADQYVIETERDREISVWYCEQSQTWLRLEAEVEKGRRLSYELMPEARESVVAQCKAS